jgi:hypothetical protein
MRQFIITFFLLTLSFNTISAQDDDSTRWYWAVSEANGALMAYTADGRVNTLIEGGVELVRGWRINDYTAVIKVFFFEDNHFYLYKLTRDEILPFSLDFDSSFLNAPKHDHTTFQDYMNIFGSTESYLLISLVTPSDDGEIQSVGLVNIEAATIELLDGVSQFDCCRFSIDSSLLLYSTSEQLIERNLVTNEETIIATPPSASQQWEMYGRIWHYDATEWAFSATSFDCDYEPFSTETYELCGLAINFFENYLVVSHTYCAADCILYMYELGSDAPAELPIPHSLTYPLRWLDGGHLFVQTSLEQYWRLDKNEDSEQLGFSSWCSHAYPTQNSPDERWWIMRVGEYDEARYGVWDTEREEFLVDRQMMGCIWIVYHDLGFIVVDQNDIYSNIFYRASDQQLIELSDEWVCFDIASDVQLLCSPVDQYLIHFYADFYVYDIELDTYTLIISDVDQVRLRVLG